MKIRPAFILESSKTMKNFFASVCLTLLSFTAAAHAGDAKPPIYLWQEPEW